MTPKPGTLIPVKVGTIEYITMVDEQGVQRFGENPVLVAAFTAGALDLNKLAQVWRETKDQHGSPPPFTQRQYAEFMMSLGYSVAGFSELSAFFSMEIENPAWDKDDDA